MAETTGSLSATFVAACGRLDIRHIDSVLPFVRALDQLSPELARSEQARVAMGSEITIWSPLRKIWKDLARAHSTFWDADDSDDGGTGETPKELALATLCASVAKFTRNLVAGIPDNQSKASVNEPELRRLLHYYTSWSAMEDEKSIAVARLLTQALSNLVTGHEELMNQVWETYLNLPEDQVIVIRLLASPDVKILLSTLIFISNCLHGSRRRTKLLCKSNMGVRICVHLLDNMLRLFEAGEGTEGAQAFDIGYTIWTRVIEEGLAGPLYKQFIMREEVITPHQTTLLKIIDSYLQSNQSTLQTSIKPETLQIHISLAPMLTRAFFSLSRYARSSMSRSLGLDIEGDDDNHSDQSDYRDPKSDRSLSPASNLKKNHTGSLESLDQSFGPPKSLDVMLPKSCEALVLVTQCMVTIAVEAEENASQLGLKGDTSPKTNMKNYFIEARASGIGVVESLIELLRLLDDFLPRINFGRPVSSASLSPGASTSSTPQGQAQATASTAVDDHGFAYLKRDLVRMLGILCHGERAVQDRVREAGGIEVIMSMCVVDDRNPYLREHAIFTLYNLLKNNSENQAVVDSIRPSREWDEDGILRDVPKVAGK